MKRLTFGWHFILLPLAAVFLFPLLWMVSTSLKPIEQAMVMPPVWLPKAHYVTMDGERIRVVLRRTNDQNYVIARLAGGDKVLLPEQAYSNGFASIVKHIGGGKTVTETVRAKKIKDAPKGSIYVIEQLSAISVDQTRRWDCVPPSAVHTEVEFAWRNYKHVFRVVPFLRYAYNTVILCLLCVLGTTMANSLVAYGFSRIEWPGRNIYFAITLATMMVPFPVTMITLYGVFKSLGWVNTWRPLWVPTFFGGAFNIFLLRQFYMTIPKTLSEAARIDGCSEFQIYWRIILPLTRPALAVVALFQFMATWNDFMGPLLYLNDQKKFTLSLGLQFFQSRHGGTEWHLLMAASALVVLPVLILFFFTQKQFIQGISTTGMKG